MQTFKKIKLLVLSLYCLAKKPIKMPKINKIKTAD